MINSVKRYQPRLATLMNLFEINYMLLVKIVASKEVQGQKLVFMISDFLSYTLVVEEVTRYTSLVRIRQNFTCSEQQPKDSDKKFSNITSFFEPSMLIRLYHDARIAEVISFQDIRYIKPRNDYPNAQMHLPDEKQQISQFLKEWLQLCHQLGQVPLAFLNQFKS